VATAGRRPPGGVADARAASRTTQAGVGAAPE
jgi:hypothetical protein